MVLVLFLLGVILFLLLILFLILLSTLQIDVQNIHIDNTKKTEIKEKTEKDILIYIQFYLFEKWKWLQVRIDNKRLSKLDIKGKLKKINLQTFRSNMKINKEKLKVVKNIPIEVKRFQLTARMGTMDLTLTTVLNFLFILLVSILLPKGVKQYDPEKYHYEITPIYANKNMVKIDLSCIIRVKMVHIINTTYMLLKKGRVKRDERTSNRRAYGYRYG